MSAEVELSMRLRPLFLILNLPRICIIIRYVIKLPATLKVYILQISDGPMSSLCKLIVEIKLILNRTTLASHQCTFAIPSCYLITNVTVWHSVFCKGIKLPKYGQFLFGPPVQSLVTGESIIIMIIMIISHILIFQLYHILSITDNWLHVNLKYIWNSRTNYWSERSACASGQHLRWPLFCINWSERSACDQRSALRWPLFCIINLFLLVVVTTAIQNHRRGCRRVSNFCMGP